MVVANKDNASLNDSYQHHKIRMKPDASPTPSRPHDDLGLTIHQRLEQFPDDFATEELEMLVRVCSHSPAKGRNAQIPARAFAILEQRRAIQQ